MELNIFDLIKKSLIYFDDQNIKYSEYIKNLDYSSKKINIKSDKNINFEHQILGTYHYDTNVFLWGWSLPYLNIEETVISRELLNYGLKLDPKSNTTDHFFLKSLLVNARIHIDNDFDLDLIQAISAYLLKNKYTFIYPLNIYNNDKLLLTSFILIKISSK